MDFLWSSKFGVTVLWLVGFFVLFNILKWIFLKKGKKVAKFFISLIVSIGGGVKGNSGISNFIGRHPVWAKFLKARLDRSKFSGLILSILSLAVLYAVSSFVGTAVDVFIIGNVLSVDSSLANLLAAFRNPLLVKIFLWVTILGNWRLVAVMMVVFLILFWLWNKKNYIIPFLASVGGGFITGAAGKYIWHRSRPLEVAVYMEKSWSFPSGHAILAVTLYGFLIYFFWKHLARWKNKIDALFLGLLVIILIGFSRLYLGVHYLSDVWAGYMVGLFWLTLGIGLAESKKTILSSPENDSALLCFTRSCLAKVGLYKVIQTKHLKIITIGFVSLLVSAYIGYGLSYKPLFNPAGEVENIRTVDAARLGDVFTDHKLPKFTETLFGNPQEPVSFIVIADNDEQLIKSFQKAGWYLAEKPNVHFLVAAFKFQVLNQPYPTAPMTPYFWQTYTNDFGFEEPTEVNSARYRHHARFWRTDFTTTDGHRLSGVPPQGSDRNIYVGITSFDMGVKWWGLTHKIKPDIDSERDYLFDDLNEASAVGDFKKIQFVDPVLGMNFTGDQFFTDGKAYIIYLK